MAPTVRRAWITSTPLEDDREHGQWTIECSVCGPLTIAWGGAYADRLAEAHLDDSHPGRHG